MMWVLWAASAWAGDCVAVGLEDVVEIVPPAVIVLGERHGTSPDVGRARRVVRRLDQSAPVTVALDVLPADRQAVLDRFADGAFDVDALPAELGWDESEGWPWAPYSGLVSGALRGWDVLAAGPSGEAPPAGVSFPVPGGYASVLGDAASGHLPPKAWEQRLVRRVAWDDHQIASAAVRSWSGEGYLVILTDRGRVEGGLGVGWQAAQLTQAPVHSFVLAWGTQPACYPGDQVWKPGVYDRMYERFEAE